MTDLNAVTAAEVIAELEAKNVRLAESARVERNHRVRHQTDAAHYRAESRDLAGRIDRIGEGLNALHSTAVQASEDNPGDHGLAARVRQARASVDLYTAATGGQQ